MASMPPLGEVSVDVRGNLDKLVEDFRNGERASRRFEKAVGGNAAAAVNKLTKEQKDLDRSLNRLQQSYAPLTAAAGRYRKELKDIDALERANRINARQADAFRTRAGRAYQQTANDLKRMGRAGIEANAALARTAQLVVAAFGTRQVAALADSYTRFTNQLKVAGIEGAALEQVQSELFDTAIKYGVELEGLGSLYGRVAQGAKELGASQSELIQFTNGVAAAIKIQGATAGQSRGALLQLSQALGGEIVRAEEFNSINEGARPILQAVAAGVDRFGGSVAKLRQEVVDGKVTSQEFFEGFLKGSADLESRAGKAVLTIGQSFTVLSNALTRYIGEADKSSGITLAVAAAIKSLADNVDILIPAVTVLATAWGVNYVRGALAAAAASGTLRASLLALAGNLGIAAVILGLGFLFAKSAQVEARMEALRGKVDEAKESLRQAEERAKGAGVEISKVGSAAGNANQPVTALGIAFKFAADQAKALADNAKLAAIAAANLRRIEAEREVQRLETMRPNRALSAVQRVTGAITPGGGAALKAQADLEKLIDAQIANQKQIAALAGREIEVLGATPDSAFQPQASSGGSAVNAKDIAKHQKMLADLEKLKVGASGRDLANINRKIEREKKIIGYLEQGVSAEAATAAASGAGARAGKEAADIQKQYVSDLAGLTQQTLAARSSLTSDIGEQAEFSRRDLEWQKRARDEAIKSNKDFSAAQKATLLKQSDILDGYQRELIDRSEQEGLARERLDISQSAQRNEIDLLQAQEDLATTQKQKREIELRILDISFDMERAALDAVLASQQSTEAEKQIARAKLAILDDLKGSAKQSVIQQTAGPLENYLNSIPDTLHEIDEAMQRVFVDRLQEINQRTAEFADNFSSAIGRAVGDLASFRNPLDVVKNLLADLAQQFTDTFITQPVTDFVRQNVGGGLAEKLVGGVSGDNGLSAAQMKAAVTTHSFTLAVAQATQALQMMAQAGGASGGGGLLSTILGIGASAFGGGGGFDVDAALLPNVGGIGSGGSVAGMGGDLFRYGGYLEGYRGGGMIRGPGSGISDSIMARFAGGGMIKVSNGEFITNAAATRRNRPLLEMINSGNMPGFGAGLLGGMLAPIMRGGNTFNFGSIVVQGGRSEREDRRTAKQYASTIRAEIARTARQGYAD